MKKINGLKIFSYWSGFWFPRKWILEPLFLIALGCYFLFSFQVWFDAVLAGLFLIGGMVKLIYNVWKKFGVTIG